MVWTGNSSSGRDQVRRDAPGAGHRAHNSRPSRMAPSRLPFTGASHTQEPSTPVILPRNTLDVGARDFCPVESLLNIRSRPSGSA